MCPESTLYTDSALELLTVTLPLLEEQQAYSQLSEVRNIQMESSYLLTNDLCNSLVRFDCINGEKTSRSNGSTTSSSFVKMSSNVF